MFSPLILESLPGVARYHISLQYIKPLTPLFGRSNAVFFFLPGLQLMFLASPTFYHSEDAR